MMSDILHFFLTIYVCTLLLSLSCLHSHQLISQVSWFDPLYVYIYSMQSLCLIFFFICLCSHADFSMTSPEHIHIGSNSPLSLEDFKHFSPSLLKKGGLLSSPERFQPGRLHNHYSRAQSPWKQITDQRTPRINYSWKVSLTTKERSVRS